MKLLAIVLCALLASTSLFVLPARGDTVVVNPALIAANPGTVSGTVDDVYRSDDVRATFNEADPTNFAGTSWLKPNGDKVTGGWTRTVGCANFSACVADNPVHDGNASIVASTGASSDLEMDVQDITPPADTTISSVAFFAWARKNQTANPNALSMDIEHPFGTNCAPLTPTLTQAFFNVSFPYPNDCDGSGAWVAADIAAVVLGPFLVVDATNKETITAAGVLVVYTDRDYQVRAYVNFTAIPSNAQLTLRYEGSSSLSGETLALQVNTAGAWTTIVNPFLTASEVSNTFILDPATMMSNSAVQFRIVDSVTNDETGSNFRLDQFVIVADTIPPVPGGNPYAIFTLRCIPGILFSIACTVVFNVAAPGIHFVGTSWYVDDVYQKEGDTAPRSASAVVSAYKFPAGTANVSVRIVLDNGQVFRIGTNVAVDNSWLLLLGLLGTIAFGAAIISLYARRHKRRTSRREKEWDDEYSFWQGVFK